MTIRSVSIPLHEGSKHIYYFRVAAENKLGTGPWVSTKEDEEEDEPDIEPTVEETVPTNGPDTMDSQDDVVDDDYNADPADDEPNNVDDTETNIISNDNDEANTMVAENRIADNTPSTDGPINTDVGVTSPGSVLDPLNDDAEAIFQTYDVDGDGFLNESEYKVCCPVFVLSADQDHLL